MTSRLIEDTMRLGAGGGVTLISAILLVCALIAKETITASPEPRGAAVGRVLDVALVPLLVVFAALLAARVLPVSS